MSLSGSRRGVTPPGPPASTGVFQILVTHVAKFHGIIKIFGQNNLKTGETVRKYLSRHRSELEGGQQPTQITPGQSIIVRHEGSWQRGLVNTLSGIKVLVNLVDTGETQEFHLSHIRTEIHSQLQSIPPLAVEYVLAEVVPPAGEWSKPSIEFVKDALKGDVCTAQIIHKSHGYDFIRVFKSDSREPFVHDMIQCGFAIAGYPSMDNVPPAENYTPPQISVMPMGPGGGPTSPGYPSQGGTRMSPQQYDYQQTSWSDGVNGARQDSRSGGRNGGQVSIRTGHNQQNYRWSERNKQGYNKSMKNSPDYGTEVRALSLDPGTWYPVTISSVEQGPIFFFIQLQNFNEKLEDLMRRINSMKLNQLPRGQIECGTPCLARYSMDNSIYRAVILSRGDSVEVQYMDYGNTESLSPDQVYELPEPYLSAEMLAVPCRLYQWPENVTGTQADMARNKLDSLSSKSLNCRVMSLEPGGGYFGNLNIVQLYEDSVDLGQELRLWLGSTGSTNASQNGINNPANRMANKTQWNRMTPVIPSTARSSISYTQVELLGTVDVYLSYHGKGPGLFYVQRADTTNQIQQIMREITNLVKSNPMPLTEPPRPGTPCLAKYTDGVWYRARVEAPGTGGHNLKPGQMIVDFVDFGNSDAVWMNQVYSIPASLVTCLPAQAVPCRLDGNFANIQTESLVKPFLDLVQDNLFRIKVEKVLSNLCVVQASTTVHPILNINSELGRMVSQLALSQTMSDSPTVLLVTHFESTNCFYGQRGTNGAEFAIFLANLAEYYSRCGICLYENFTESHVGEVCGIVDTSNPNFKYYRCKVLSEQKSTADIRILDVGGMKRVDKSCLMTLPQQFQSPPEFGFQCSLGFPTPLADNNIRANFQDCFVEVQKVRESGEIVIVKITPNPSASLKNTHIMRAIKEASPPQKPVMFEPYSIHKMTRPTRPPPRVINNSVQPPENKYARGVNHSMQQPPPNETIKNPSEFTGRNIASGPPGGRRGTVEPSGVYTRNNDAAYQGGNSRYQANRRGGDIPREFGDGGPPPGRAGERNDRSEGYRGMDFRNANKREQKRFERGDLRNSLREKRAAREIILSKPVTQSFTFPKLHAGMKLQGKISWMFDPGNFYIQLERHATDFDNLMEDMQSEFRSGPFDPKQWKKGTPVAAKYSMDDCWYRGKVVGQRDKFVDVYFVDFGNTDKVDDINVLALPQEFGKLPIQAINCSLVGVDDLAENWEKMKSSYAKYFSDSQYSVHIVKAGKVCQVNLNNGSVAASLVKDLNNTVNNANHRNIGEERLKKNRKKDSELLSERNSQEKEKTNNRSSNKIQANLYPEFNPKELLGTTKSVLVSNHNGWKEFWIQLDQSKLDDLENMLRNEELLGDNVDNLNPGERCLVNTGEQWLRGQVTREMDGNSTIFCVDTGLTLSNNEAANIRNGSNEIYESYPPLAIRCKLDTKLPYFEKILEKSSNLLRLRFKNYHRNTFMVRLEKEKTEKKEGSVPAGGDRNDVGVSVTYLEAVNKIWFVPGEKLERLNLLMEELSACKDDLETSQDIVVDKMYAVKYHEDGEIYRAKVVDRDANENQVQVHFIDYGNHEVVPENEVLTLPEKFHEDSQFASMIRLKGADYALDSTDIKEKLEDLLLNSHVIVKMSSSNSSTTKDEISNEGILIVDGKLLNVNQWLRYKDPNFNLFRHCGAVRIDCFISNASETRSNVWILEKHMLQDLERMMSDLQHKVDRSHKPKKLEKGRMVCARYSKDGEFYRAKITGLKGQKADVYYLDFGNSESLPVTELFELPKELILHPGFSMKVAVDNKENVRLLTAEEMATLISDGVKLVAELVQPRLNIVRLYLNGERVGYLSSNQKIKSEDNEMSVFPPARIHTAQEELCAYLGEGKNNSFILQNVSCLGKVTARLDRWTLETVCDLTLPGNIQHNNVYIYQDDKGLRHRVQVINQKHPALHDADNSQADKTLQLLFADSQKIKELSLSSLENKLFSCPPSIIQICQAAIRISSAEFQQEFKLAGQLLCQAFSNNRLLIKNYHVNVGVQENGKKQTVEGSLPNVILNIVKLSILHKFSAQELCSIRNNIIDHFINDSQLELNELEENPKDETVMKESIEHRNPRIITSLNTFQPIADNENDCMTIHKDLPKLKLSQDVKFRILDISENNCVISIVNTNTEKNIEQILAETKLDTLETFDAIAPECLAVYVEGSKTNKKLYRCIILNVTNNIANVYLIDSAKIRYCDITELRKMPSSLQTVYPTAIQVAKIRGIMRTEVTQRGIVSEETEVYSGKFMPTLNGLEVQKI